MRSKTGIFSWCVGGILVFSFVWQQLQSVRLGFEVEKTRRLAQAQRDRNAYLELELERLISPDSLAKAARERLGMAPPTPEALIVLDAPEDTEGFAPGWLRRVAMSALASRPPNL